MQNTSRKKFYEGYANLQVNADRYTQTTFGETNVYFPTKVYLVGFSLPELEKRYGSIGVYFNRSCRKWNIARRLRDPTIQILRNY